MHSHVYLESNPLGMPDLPHLAIANINPKAFDTFKVTEQERARAKNLELCYSTNYPVNVSELHGMERKMGIRAVDIESMVRKKLLH